MLKKAGRGHPLKLLPVALGSKLLSDKYTSGEELQHNSYIHTHRDNRDSKPFSTNLCFSKIVAAVVSRMSILHFRR